MVGSDGDPDQTYTQTHSAACPKLRQHSPGAQNVRPRGRRWSPSEEPLERPPRRGPVPPLPGDDSNVEQGIQLPRIELRGPFPGLDGFLVLPALLERDASAIPG